MLPQTATEIILGNAPAMRRQGTAPFVIVRQKNGESIFAAVHHPYGQEPLIQKVKVLDVCPAGTGAVALQITLPDRVDTIVATKVKLGV